MINPIKPNIGL